MSELSLDKEKKLSTEKKKENKIELDDIVGDIVDAAIISHAIQPGECPVPEPDDSVLDSIGDVLDSVGDVLGEIGSAIGDALGDLF